MSELIEKQKVLDALREIATEKFSLDDPYGVYINVLIDVEEKICRLPVVQPNGPDNLVKDSQRLAKELVNDCISRKAALDALEKSKEIYFDSDRKFYEKLTSGIHTYRFHVEDLAGNKVELKQRLQCYPPLRNAKIVIDGGEEPEYIPVPPPPL